MPIKVLVVDDSVVMRRVLSELINGEEGLEVVGAAENAQQAREEIKRLNPDVLTLDVNMPGMDGIEFLDRLMRLRPMPVVMVSSFTAEGSDTTLRALEAGAVDFIGKPRLSDPVAMREYAEELGEKIRGAKLASVRRSAPQPAVSRLASAPPVMPTPVSPPVKGAAGDAVSSASRIIYLGASTGGTEAIKVFLQGIPANSAPILIVQHMPEMFTASFAKRLDGLSAATVIEAQGGEVIKRGMVYIAPGHSHMTVRRSGAGLVTELHKTPPVNRHRPSVDVLFDSAVEVSGRNALGVLLTGMGKDGAEGLLRMRKAGAPTFAQDEASCVVFGMPREAIVRGGADEVVPLDKMAGRVLATLGGGR